MRVSPSGASGDGGLIDGIRISVAERLDQLVDGEPPRPRRVELPRGRRRAAAVTARSPNTSAIAMPITKPPNIRATTMHSSNLP